MFRTNFKPEDNGNLDRVRVWNAFAIAFIKASEYQCIVCLGHPVQVQLTTSSPLPLHRSQVTC